MSHELSEHIANAGKTVAGGVATGGSVYGFISHMSIEQAQAYATLAASLATAIYFTVVTVIAILKYRNKKNAKV